LAFSCGSQHVACTGGAQQAALVWSGAAAGVFIGLSIEAPLVGRFSEADGKRREWMRTGPVLNADT
jgi:hypothetical protein